MKYKDYEKIPMQENDAGAKTNGNREKNIDFDSFDFSNLSIDEKFWALVFFIFANCKDIEFIEKIKEKFNIDNEKLRKEINI